MSSNTRNNFAYFITQNTSTIKSTRKVKVLSLPETIKEKIDISSEGPVLLKIYKVPLCLMFNFDSLKDFFEAFASFQIKSHSKGAIDFNFQNPRKTRFCFCAVSFVICLD